MADANKDSEFIKLRDKYFLPVNEYWQADTNVKIDMRLKALLGLIEFLYEENQSLREKVDWNKEQVNDRIDQLKIDIEMNNIGCND